MRHIPIRQIKGVGPKRAALFEACGVFTARDLILTLPRDYLDYSESVTVASLCDGALAAVRLRICAAPRFYSARGMRVVSVDARDETGAIALKWFNQPYRAGQVRVGDTVYACGRVSSKKGLSLINPTLCDEPPGILPVYATTRGLNQRVWRETVRRALEQVWEEIDETLPSGFRERYGLCSRQLALLHAHFPHDCETNRAARKRLDFENALSYMVAIELAKAERARANGFSFDTEGVLEKLSARLPFALTDAQIRVMNQIAADMAKPVPMNRLLQGDVGSGKTAVAMYALCIAAANGRQGALLAPTEILAEQSFRQMQTVFGASAVLLTGGMKKSLRDAAKARIQNGNALCVVGTHALLTSDVRFCDLGCVVTDEQQRFGVQQRARMQEKGARPDTLVMSATPIPRTLMLLFYGDLDVSVIDEPPPNRKRIKTRIISNRKRADMYAYLLEQARAGIQSYVVCPFIEDSEAIEAPSVETVYSQMCKKAQDVRIAKLHGRMREDEKNRIMRAFREGEIGILVATSVVEVGVDVPNACNMVIEGAERFGLSQLHQLRGRVGRGERQSYCFLLHGAQTDEENARMRILAQTDDGFEIARQDLLLRGPGDFIGMRQHGQIEGATLYAAMDANLLEQAKEAALAVVETPNDESAQIIAFSRERFETALCDVAMN